MDYPWSERSKKLFLVLLKAKHTPTAAASEQGGTPKAGQGKGKRDGNGGGGKGAKAGRADAHGKGSGGKGGKGGKGERPRKMGRAEAMGAADDFQPPAQKNRKGH